MRERIAKKLAKMYSTHILPEEIDTVSENYLDDADSILKEIIEGLTVISDRFLNKKYPHTFDSSECMGCAKHLIKDQYDHTIKQLEE